MLRHRHLVVAAAALAAVAAGCGSKEAAGGGAGGAEQVTLRLNWVVAGNHAPFYLAQEKGYWKDCGLDVKMTAGKGSSDTATLVANGSQDFGVSDAVSVVAGRAHGLPVKSIGVLYQSNPSAIVAKKSTGIGTLDDVEGKTWGAVPGASPYLLLKALFKENDIGEGDVKEANIAPPGIAELKTGKVDFITFFANEAANVDADPEHNLSVLPFKDFGQDIYGLTLISNEKYIDAHPDQVSCFTEGVRKGFEAAESDPAAALDALEQGAPETATNRDVQEQLLDGAFEYATGDLLAQDAAKWEATQKVLVDAGIVEKTQPPKTFYTQP
jgi:NitT/TauT family transport system substrate-binding protein